MPLILSDIMSNVKRKYFGALFDAYTPQVEAQLLRDCMVLLEVARKQRYDEVVIICESDKPDQMLAALGIRRVGIPSLTTEWLVYRSGEQWPMPPENTTFEVQRDLYVPVKSLTLEEPSNQENGYFLPPQGRINNDTINLQRPAPSGGYAPADPGLMLIWSKTSPT